MEKLKERITENGIDYILVGDYYIPDLKLPEENRPIGRYGRLHRDYLKQEHPARFSSLILTGKLWTYLGWTFHIQSNVNQFAVYDFPRPVADIVHPAYPFKLVLGFQFLRHSLGSFHLLND